MSLAITQYIASDSSLIALYLGRKNEVQMPVLTLILLLSGHTIASFFLNLACCAKLIARVICSGGQTDGQMLPNVLSPSYTVTVAKNSLKISRQ